MKTEIRTTPVTATKKRAKALYWSDLTRLKWLPGKLGEIIALQPLSPPAPLTEAGGFDRYPVDHIAFAFVNAAQFDDHYEKLLAMNLPLIEPKHLWPNEAKDCPQVPLADCKWMASFSVDGTRLVCLAPYSPGDVIDAFVDSNGGPGVHHFAITVPDLPAALEELKSRFHDARQITVVATDGAAMSQVFLRLGNDLRIFELVERYGDFDGTFTCLGVRQLTEGERADQCRAGMR